MYEWLWQRAVSADLGVAHNHSMGSTCTAVFWETNCCGAAVKTFIPAEIRKQEMMVATFWIFGGGWQQLVPEREVLSVHVQNIYRVLPLTMHDLEINRRLCGSLGATCCLHSRFHLELWYILYAANCHLVQTIWIMLGFSTFFPSHHPRSRCSEEVQSSCPSFIHMSVHLVNIT